MIRFAVALALCVVALTPLARADDPFKMISADDVQKILGTPGVHVFDANSVERYEKGHLPGAKHVTKATLADNLPADKNATLVFYCTNPK